MEKKSEETSVQQSVGHKKDPLYIQAEQAGYDYWVELWAHYGYSPILRDLSYRAKHLKDPARSGMIAGWRRAKEENNEG